MIGTAYLMAPSASVSLVSCVARKAKTTLTAFTAVVLLSVLAISPVRSQPATGPISLHRATRTDLAARVAELETATSNGSLQKDKQLKAMAQLADMRTRLADGDFRVGDRFFCTVTLDSTVSDTLAIRDGLLVSVANLPDVSLKGVLRSELDTVLTTHILRYFRRVRVRTIPLAQLSIVGAVARPGFYWASPDRPMAELIMLAGGPLPEAKLREMEVRRANRVILASKDSRLALEAGRTIEQVDVRSGDEVRIPVKRKLNWSAIIQLFFVLSSLFFGFISFLQWYYGRQER